MSVYANLVPFSGSLAALLNQWFFSLPFAFWLLVFIMAFIAIASYVTKQLTLGGSIAAFLVGFIPTWILGFGALVSFMLFFISAGVLGKLAKRMGASNPDKIQKKGGCRDSIQVFANGGMALLCAIIYAFAPSPITLVMFGAGIGEAASDTFAGEVGILSKSKPVFIITGKPMKPGLSGAVSGLGTASGMLGAVLIGLCWMGSFLPLTLTSVFYASVVSIGSFFGCIMDSVLGATVQAHYYDEEKDLLTEHPEVEGKKLPLVRGIRWIDNDVVNLMSNVIAVMLAGSLALVLG